MKKILLSCLVIVFIFTAMKRPSFLNTSFWQRFFKPIYHLPTPLEFAQKVYDYNQNIKRFTQQYPLTSEFNTLESALFFDQQNSALRKQAYELRRIAKDLWNAELKKKELTRNENNLAFYKSVYNDLENINIKTDMRFTRISTIKKKPPLYANNPAALNLFEEFTDRDFPTTEAEEKRRFSEEEYDSFLKTLETEIPS